MRWLFCYKFNYPAITLKTFTWLYSGVSVDLPYSSAHNTAVTQAAYTPPCRTLYRSAQPPIIIIYTGVYAGASLLWIHARRCSILQTMQARRGLLLSCAECWQVLTHCQHYRPGAPTEGVSVSTCTWSARRRLDTSHARRFAVWHWVNGQSAQGQLGTLHPAGSPAAGTRRAAWNH